VSLPTTKDNATAPVTAMEPLATEVPKKKRARRASVRIAS